jgi:hypothetical protein
VPSIEITTGIATNQIDSGLAMMVVVGLPTIRVVRHPSTVSVTIAEAK